MCNRILFIIAISLVYFGCKTLPAPEIKDTEVYARYLRTIHDTCHGLCNRFVFTKTPCSKTALKRNNGRILPQFRSDTLSDSACYTCTEYTTPYTNLLIWLTYKQKNYTYTLSTDGRVLLDGPYCSKKPIQVRSLWSDSNASIAVWHTWREQKGELTIYMAEESFNYPYYKPNRVDSFVYDFNRFCEESEAQDEIKSNQEMYTKHMTVSVHPNPYKIDFELIASRGKLPAWMFGSDPLTITFYDDLGNTLLTKPFALEQTYRFEFPDIKSGKLLFYRIQWSVYSLSGQILKS